MKIEKIKSFLNKTEMHWKYNKYNKQINLNVDLDNFDNTINEALKLIDDFLKECA